MNELLARILDAHGGMERWRGYEKVEATIISGGGFFALKGGLQDSTPRGMAGWQKGHRSRVLPSGAPDKRRFFAPGRIPTEKPEGSLVAERAIGFPDGDPLRREHRALIGSPVGQH